MANLSELCAVLPTEWVEREEHKAIEKAIGMEKKMAWKVAMKARKEARRAYLAREEKRAMRSGYRGESFGASRRKVARETMPEPERKETTADIFFAGKGERQPKKAKNRASAEEAGSIGRQIVVKRFPNTHLTCVCKSRVL